MRFRGCGAPARRARHLPRPLRLAHGTQGVGQGLSSHSGTDVRRHRVPRVLRRPSRPSPSTQVCLCGTASPTSGTRRSPCATSSPCASMARSRTARSFAYVGDATNSVANSLLIAGARMGMDVRMDGRTEVAFQPTGDRRGRRGDSCPDRCPHHPHRRAWGHFVHTDVWVSMGEPEETWKKRINLLLPYQVNTALLK